MGTPTDKKKEEELEAAKHEKYIREARFEAKAHRKWVESQPKGPPNFMVGDIIRFRFGGGLGRISDVSVWGGEEPVGYATRKVPGFKGHAENKTAWHVEGDFLELVVGSPLRNLDKILPDPDAIDPVPTDSPDTYLDRQKEPLPSKQCDIEIFYNGKWREKLLWVPRRRGIVGSKGFLGTAVRRGQLLGHGYQAWHQNDTEFRYYRLPTPSQLQSK